MKSDQIYELITQMAKEKNVIAEEKPHSSDQRINFFCLTCRGVFNASLLEVYHADAHCKRKRGLSRLESDTSDALIELKITFETQYYIPGTPNKRYKYDFFVPDKNAIIECHGPQHYFENHVFNGSRTKFTDQVRRDQEKLAQAYQFGYEFICLDFRMEAKAIKEILRGALA